MTEYQGRLLANTLSAVPVIVLGSASSTFLGVVRGLGRRNIPVIGLSSSSPDKSVNRSRYLTRLFTIDNWEALPLKLMLENIREDFGDPSRMVVLPANDASLLAYNQLRGQLDPCFCDSLPAAQMILA